MCSGHIATEQKVTNAKLPSCPNPTRYFMSAVYYGTFVRIVDVLAFIPPTKQNCKQVAETFSLPYYFGSGFCLNADRSAYGSSEQSLLITHTVVEHALRTLKNVSTDDDPFFPLEESHNKTRIKYIENYIEGISPSTPSEKAFSLYLHELFGDTTSVDFDEDAARSFMSFGDEDVENIETYSMRRGVCFIGVSIKMINEDHTQCMEEEREDRDTASIYSIKNIIKAKHEFKERTNEMKDLFLFKPSLYVIPWKCND